jgi:phosphatidate cytidylyltransferase
MSYPDDPYRDAYSDDADDDTRAAQGRSGDPRGAGRDGGRGGRRRATQPARPAWDAMTYGRPDDARRPVRSAQPPEPPADVTDGYAPTGQRDSYQSDWFEPAPYGGYQQDAPPAGTERSEYAYAADAYPAGDTYPSADPYQAGAPDSYAPDAYTSYRAFDPGPHQAPEPAEPVYVASGLYPDSAGGSTSNGGSHGGDPAYPGGHSGPPQEPTSKGGRNLPAAIGVGVGLGALVLASLFLWRPAFLGVVAVALAVGVWELVRALRGSGFNPPLIPLVAGGAIMAGLAWWGAADALTFGLVVTIVAAMIWRLADGPPGYGRDVSMAALVAVYVPFLGGFAAMLASAPDGHLRVLVTLIAVVLSDTGGYIVGAKLGRHAMAPSVSPKKSWEGLAGSLLASGLGSAIVLWLLMDVGLWWGALFGLAVATASVIGDLGESMVKRSLGVKDMSNILPGHGGIMDRLDSILFAAPAGYLLLATIAPI